MAAIRGLARRLWANDHGAELIEFAVALPILLLVVAGIVDFAFLFQRYEVVTNAAREGARVGLLPDYDTTDVQNRVNSYLAASGLTDASAPAPDVSYGSIEIAPGGPTIDVVRVEVQYPHQFLFLGPMAALAGGGPKADVMLTAASTMRREVAAAP
jgi:Flp pilus assembly protein TadG